MSATAPSTTWRSATGVREYLTTLGVSAEQVAIVSKGKEAPLCTETNEQCWVRNRTGAFLPTAR
jgi:peptidoglycan-associated lipoprotein